MRVPAKKQLILGGKAEGGTVVGRLCAEALRPAKVIPNDTPAPTISFQAARKLRRDLIAVMFLDDIRMPLFVQRAQSVWTW